MLLLCPNRMPKHKRRLKCTSNELARLLRRAISTGPLMRTLTGCGEALMRLRGAT